MGDSYDPCACVWDHELAMQRLLSLLRQSQSYCTDNECLNVPRLPDHANEQSNSFMMMCLVVLFGLFMYAFRPQSLRSSESNDLKRRNNGPDFGGDPPPATN